MNIPPLPLFGRGVLAASLGLLFLAPGASRGATVLTDCSLEALQAALAVGGHITFDCDGTITLLRPLVVSKNAKLDAAGRNVVIRGLLQSGETPAVQIFRIDPGVRLSLTNLTLVNGQNTNGGAIYNAGTLIASGCVFSNNFALGLDGADGAPGEDGGRNVGGVGGTGGAGTRGAGGALYNLGSALLIGCTFTTNSAFGGDGGDGGPGGDGDFQGGDGGNGGSGGDGVGGAIYSTGSLTVSNCTFLLNAAVGGQAGSGSTNGTGAIQSFEGHGGAGGAARGGAIYSVGFATNAGCTFAYNQAFSGDSADAGTSREIVEGHDGPDGSGGAVHNRGTNLLVNCTFYANQVTAGNGGKGADSGFVGGDGGDGGDAWGGNYYSSGSVRMTNCTLSAGLAVPGSFGTGGGGFSGTNGLISYAGTNGSTGASRGGNLASGGGSFLIANCILADPPSGTNVVITPIITKDVTNVPARVVVTTTNTFGLTNCSFIVEPSCRATVVLTNTVITESVSTRLIPSTSGPAGCTPTDPPCLTSELVTNLVAGVLKISTNIYVVASSSCTNGRCVSSVQVTNVTSITNLVTTNTFVLSNSVCFNVSCSTNVVLTSIVQTNLPVTISSTNYTTNTVVVAGINAYGTFVDGGYNLSGDGTPAFSGTSRNHVNPMLGPLQNNGGPTETLALQTGSPAIDQIAASQCPPTDQRGIPRPVRTYGDIGAYEAEGLNLSGRVTHGEIGLPGVTLTAGKKTATTDNNGDYILYGFKPLAPNTVIPALAGFAFTPPFTNVALEADTAGADFVAMRVFEIHGQVTANAAGLPNVQVQAVRGQTNLAITGASGQFTLTNLPEGTYTVSAVHSNYLFGPSSTNVTVTNLTGPFIAVVTFRATNLISLKGRITKESGAGLSNVVVSAGGRTDLTGPQGNYYLTNVPSGELEVVPALAGWKFDPPSHSGTYERDQTDLNFMAIRVFNISGQVLYKGVGLGKVTVTAGGQTNVTAWDGRYTLTNVPKGTYAVVPSLIGYRFELTNVFGTVGPDTNNVNFTAKGVLSITGAITNYSGAVSNVTVKVDGLVGAIVITRSVTNGANGAYSVANLAPGTYRVSPDNPAPGKYVLSPVFKTVVVATSPVAQVDFAALPTYDVVGRVMKDSNGLGGVLLQATGVTSVSNSTDSDGFFRLRGVAAGVNGVVPSKDGHVFEPPSRSLFVSSNTNEVNFTAFRGFSVSGRVTADGSALFNVTVTCSGVTNTTGGDGEYALNGVPIGPGLIVPSLKNFEFDPPVKSVNVSSNIAGMDFSATRLFNIGGVVKDLDDDPVPAVTVRLYNSQGTNITDTTDARGRYQFTRLRAGTYGVYPLLSDAGYEPFTDPARSITVGPDDINVDFSAKGSYTLSGRIANGDLDTPGLAGVTVTAGTKTQMSGEDGSFAFAHLPARQITVVPSLTNHLFFPASINVTLPPNPTHVNFAWAHVIRVAGSVLDEKGRGVNGVTMTLTNSAALTNGFTTAGQSNLIVTNGDYAFTNVPAGKVVITPSRSGYGFDPPSYEDTLTNDVSNINFTNFPVYQISGRAAGTNGQGVAGVMVTAASSCGTNSTMTTNDGTYTIAGVRACSNHVTAFLEGYRFTPGARPVVVTNHVGGVDFTASGDCIIQGTVTTNGRPAAGVVVTLTDLNRTVQTTDNGMYGFTDLVPGTNHVQPSLSGYVFVPASSSVVVSSGANVVDFEGKQLFSVSGRVREGANGLGGVTLLASNAANDTTNVTAVTDPGGNYILPFVAEGINVITPSKPGYVFVPAVNNIVVSGGTNRADFEAFPGWTISGRITEKGDAGLGGVRVSLVGLPNRADSQANGDYRLTNLAVGTYTVVPSKAGYGFAGSPQVVDVTTNKSNVDFKADGFYRLGGQITSVPGAPTANFQVTVGNRVIPTETNGAYLFMVGEGPFVVTPSLTNWLFYPAAQTNTIPPERTNVNFMAAPSITISGQITNTDLTPLPNVVVTVTNVGLAAAVLSPATGTDGHYTNSRVPGGSLVIIPSRAGYGFEPSSFQTNDLFQDATNINFEGFSLFSLSGRITDAGGTGVTGVTVRAESVPDSRYRYTNTTRVGGTYAILGVRPGNYHLTPQLEGYRFDPMLTNVTVGPSANNLNFTAEGAFSITGSITNRSGAAVSNVTVWVTNQNQTILWTYTGIDGNYTVTNLSPGTYKLGASLDRYIFDPRSTSLVLTSSTARANFQAIRTFLISGRVTEGSSGLALVSLSVTGFTSVTTTTDSGGYYTLAGAAAGTNTVRLVKNGYGFKPPNAFFQDLESDVILDFAAFRVFTISGRVTKGSSGFSNLTVTLNTLDTNRAENTDITGRYSFSNLLAGTNTVTPQPAGAGFKPVSTNVVVTTSDISGVDFAFEGVELTIRWLTNGLAQLTLRGVPLNRYQVQASTELGPTTSWQLLSTLVTGTNGSVQYTDPDSTNQTARFYRARTP